LGIGIEMVGMNVRTDRYLGPVVASPEFAGDGGEFKKSMYVQGWPVQHSSLLE
jgi:hypothetical protein